MKRTSWGVAATAVWLVGFGWWSLHGELPVTGNEWGDWAAGMFAPVAFLWLVLGYFQQGEELRLQAQALNLQVRELKDSVEQQTALARTSARQAELLEKGQEVALRAQVLEHQPRFGDFRAEGPSEPGERHFTISAENLGRPCHDVQVFFEQDGAKQTFSVETLWGNEARRSFRTHPDSDGVAVFYLRYMDELLVVQEQHFRVFVGSPRHKNGELISPSLTSMTFYLPISLDDLIE